MAETTAITKKRKTISRYHEGDYWLIAMTLILSLFGLIMVFSASYYTALSKYGDQYYYLKDGITWCVIGWAVFLLASYIDYHVWRKLMWFFLAVGFLLLIYLLVAPSPLTITINNAKRWINLFGIGTLMPGEVMKACLIFFFAAWYSKVKGIQNKIGKGVIFPLGIAVASFGLIYLQPNLSTAGIVLVLCLGMMLLGGVRWKHLLISVASGVGGLAALVVWKGADYMLSRLDNFWKPFTDALGKGYQVCQGLLAFGSGGILGVGLGNSVQKALYLPEPMNDFILPIIGEELGFIGVLALIIVYVILLWRLFVVGIQAKDKFGLMLAGGVAIHMGLQVIINIAVVTASFPPTGVVLPLISLGGTATVLLMGELGVAYNVSRQTRVITKEQQ